MDIIMWTVTGLIVGIIASIAVDGSGFGIIGDIIIGIVGCFVGSELFRSLGWSAPFSGYGNTLFVGVIGAIVLIFGLRIVRSVVA